MKIRDIIMRNLCCDIQFISLIVVSTSPCNQQLTEKSNKEFTIQKHFDSIYRHLTGLCKTSGALAPQTVLPQLPWKSNLITDYSFKMYSVVTHSDLNSAVPISSRYMVINLVNCPSNIVSITSVTRSFIVSASENGFLCLPKIHSTLSEHCVAVCCCVIDVTRILLAAWYDDLTACIFVVLTSEGWGKKFLWFVSWRRFKLQIFITAIVSWHIKHMGLLESPLFTVHFSFSSEHGTHHFHAVYSQQNVKMWTAKTKVKVKNCTGSSE